MISEDELYNMYWVKGMSLPEIAKKIGVVSSTVLNWMKVYGIETRTISESLIGKFTGIFILTKEELYDMYCIKEMSTIEIAEEIDVTSMTVSNWMKTYGIKTRTNSESKLNGISMISEEKLYDMYQVQEMSTIEIAEMHGVAHSTVNNWMRKYGIEIRTISEARLNGDFIGEKNGRWKGGVSFEPYCDKFNKQFKESVRERDDYTCQLCGYEQKPTGEKLSVHHIHYDKENCYPDVVALCRSCNSKVNSDRNYWEEYFENQLIERGLYCWSIQAE